MTFKHLLPTVFAVVIFFSFNASAALNVPAIKLELAKLESVKDKDEGLKKCEKLLATIEQEEEKTEKESAEIYTWKGIVLAKMGHYKAPNLKALGYAKQARGYLEQAIEMNKGSPDSVALNALGILYHRVPRFISFGDNDKAEEYFKQAITTSSNLDTNWRYGEFLIEEGKKEEGLKLLTTALSKVDPTKPDEKIKEEIIRGLIKENESN